MQIVFTSAGSTTSTPLLCVKASSRRFNRNLYPRLFTMWWEQNRRSPRLSASSRLHLLHPDAVTLVLWLNVASPGLWSQHKGAGTFAADWLTLETEHQTLRLKALSWRATTRGRQSCWLKPRAKVFYCDAVWIVPLTRLWMYICLSVKFLWMDCMDLRFSCCFKLMFHSSLLRGLLDMRRDNCGAEGEEHPIDFQVVLGDRFSEKVWAHFKYRKCT